MSDVTINTWKDLLNQAAGVPLLWIDETTGQGSITKTSTFSPLGFAQHQLPSHAYVVPNLPKRMSEHLDILLAQHYSMQAAMTSFTDGVENSRSNARIVAWVWQTAQANARLSPTAFSGITVLTSRLGIQARGSPS